jgi:hypothetical protein
MAGVHRRDESAEAFWDHLSLVVGALLALIAFAAWHP